MKYKWCVLLAAFLCCCGVAEAADPEQLAENATQEAENTGKKESPDTLDQEKSAAAAPKEKESEKRLAPLRTAPLSEKEFEIRARGVYRLGTPLSEVVADWGEPERRITGPVHDEYAWEGFSVSALKELPERYLSKKTVNADAEGPWVTSFYVSGKDAAAVSGISAGDSREKLLRTYGNPSGLLWDGKLNLFYLRYAREGELLSLAVKENKVSGIRLSYDENAGEKESGVTAEAAARFKDRDFRVAGYALDEYFKERPWMIWEKKAVNSEEEIWYYPGFSVRMDAKTKRIGSLSVTDPRMLTSRGVSVGDHRTTLEAFYGDPEKVEMNELEGEKQVVYIYFSRDQKRVLLFYIDAKKETVTHIVVMKNPLAPSDFKPLTDRINQVREKNSAGAK